jgi:Transposase and inactivated derivatives, IS30 family
MRPIGFAQARPREDWSPDQISNHAAISIETVYQRVDADKRTGGSPWKHLRGQKQRRKRYGKHDRRGIIPNRLSIEQRPAVVEERSRIGDWEADTVIGKNHKQAIVKSGRAEIGIHPDSLGGAQDRRCGEQSHDQAAQAVLVPGAHHHLRQRQGVCRARHD